MCCLPDRSRRSLFGIVVMNARARRNIARAFARVFGSTAALIQLLLDIQSLQMTPSVDVKSRPPSRGISEVQFPVGHSIPEAKTSCKSLILAQTTEEHSPNCQA